MKLTRLALSVGFLAIAGSSSAHATSIFDAVGGSSYLKSTGATSQTNTNWSSGGTYSNPPGATDIAEFGPLYVEPSTAVSATNPFGPNLHGSYNITDLNGTSTSLGLAATADSATDNNTEAVGAVSYLGITGAPFYIGNNYASSSTSGYNANLEFNGVTLNSVANTIISNTASSQTLNFVGSNGGLDTFAMILGTTANVIQTSATDTTNITANIYEVNSGSALTTMGGGTLNLSGANVYSGGTTITAGTLIVGNAQALGKGSVGLTGGTLSIGSTGTVSSLTLALNQSFSMSSGTLSLYSGAGSLGSISGSGTGTFTITGGTLNLNSSLSGAQYSSTYNVLSGFSSGSVSGLSFTGYDSTDYTANLSAGGVLSFSPVATPEPSTWAMLIGAVVLLAVGFRTRRAVRQS